MYTVIAILLTFLIAVFSILLYFKTKKTRQELLLSGTCPACHATTKTFKDEKTGVLFKNEPIKSKLLKKHGCSGTSEIQYDCTNCGLKEIHTTTGYGCSL